MFNSTTLRQKGWYLFKTGGFSSDEEIWKFIVWKCDCYNLWHVARPTHLIFMPTRFVDLNSQNSEWEFGWLGNSGTWSPHICQTSKLSAITGSRPNPWLQPRTGPWKRRVRANVRSWTCTSSWWACMCANLHFYKQQAGANGAAHTHTCLPLTQNHSLFPPPPPVCKAGKIGEH